MRIAYLAVIALVCAMLGVVQFGTVMMPRPIGVSIYRALDHIAPAPYVEETLANYELQRRNLVDAQHYALRIAPSPRRDDLLGQIAQASGLEALAAEYFFAAPDVDRMQKIVMNRALTDAPGALDLEVRFSRRLSELQTHPDALADSYFMAGNLAQMLGRHPESLAHYESALQLAPLNVKYILGGANEAYVMGNYPEAKRLFQHGIDVAPGSGDMYAGLGLVALRTGDRAGAQTYAARARAVDPHSQELAGLEQALK